VFEDAGYAPVAVGWPEDPATVAEGNRHPEVFAGKTVGQLAEHCQGLIGQLDKRPAIIGHSYGGLLAQMLAGSGKAQVSVSISSAPFRGILPLPISALRSAKPVLRNPLNRKRAVRLSYGEFRYAFANAVDESEARELYERFTVPASGALIFQAAAANLNPRSDLKVDHTAPGRGPMLMVSAEEDHITPRAVQTAMSKKQKRNEGVTEVLELQGRGHALTIDRGWREVADEALAFVRRFAEPSPVGAKA
jgi:pimeloyl-ACP methyl ester carboxylesterase